MFISSTSNKAAAHSFNSQVLNFVANHRWEVLAIDAASIAAAVSIGMGVLASNPAGWAISAVTVLGLVALSASSALAYTALNRSMPNITPNPTFGQKAKDFVQAHKTKLFVGGIALAAAVGGILLATTTTKTDPVQNMTSSFFNATNLIGLGIGLTSVATAVYITNDVLVSLNKRFAALDTVSSAEFARKHQMRTSSSSSSWGMPDQKDDSEIEQQTNSSNATMASTATNVDFSNS